MPPSLPGRFLHADGLGKEQTSRHIAGGDPEDGQLQMPGPQNIAGQDRRKIKAVEGAGIGPVMADSPAHQNLQQKKQGTTTKNLMVARWPWTGRTGQHGRMDMLLFPLPAQVVEFAEGKENQRRAGQQGDQAQGTPQYRFAGQGIAGQGVVRKIIGI